jgi:phytoene dehydrogenase-like protein
MDCSDRPAQGRPVTRVAIIGAGPNGLVAAAHLAQAGVEVTVLEQAEQGFGGISSSPGPLPGFTHDICAGFFPLSLASPALRSLELDVDWIAPETVMAHPFRDGTAIALERDIAATAAGLGPGGRAYERFMRPLVDSAVPLMDAALEPVPPGGAALEAAARLRLDLLRLAWRSVQPAGFMGRHWLGDARAAAWLAGSTAHSDLDPTSPGGGAFALVLKLLGHRYGWPFPRGGAQAIGEALRARIEGHGGSVRHGAGVEQILTAGRRATGVQLAGGERIEADAVIATVSAKPLLDLLPDGVLPRGLESRLRKWRYDAGTFKVDFALSQPVPWTAEECRRAGAIHVGDRLSDFTASLRAARAGEFPQRPALVIGQHSLYDDTRAPADRHTLYCYARSPLRLTIPAEHAADLVEQRIEEFAPGFRETVLGRSVRSPEQMQEHNASMIGGDLGGGSYQLYQQLFLRPHPRAWRTRTPVAGLYFAGTSTHPGGGVHGTQGLAAAHFVMRSADKLAVRRK